MSTKSKIYFVDGNVVAQSGDVKIYLMDNQLFLEIGPGHNLWALESEYAVYMDQLRGKPFGNCLEVGLGLGIASRCILTYPNVRHLTTIEKNNDVIEAHDKIVPLLNNKLTKWIPYDNNKHTIINDDGLHYLTTSKEVYDFIFIDFYKQIDEDTLPDIKDIVTAGKKCLSEKGIIMGWLDPFTPPEFYKEFENIFI